MIFKNKTYGRLSFVNKVSMILLHFLNVGIRETLFYEGLNS